MNAILLHCSNTVVYAKGHLRNSAAYWWLRACSLHVVAYKIQNTWLIQRLEASLILNIFIVGRACRWLFDHDTLYSRAKQLNVIDLPYISVYLSHLVIVLVCGACDLGARFDRTVRWLSAYPKFGSFIPWQCWTLH